MMIVEIILGITLVVGIFIGVIYILWKKLQRVTLELNNSKAINSANKNADLAVSKEREEFKNEWPDNDSKIEARTFFSD